MSLALRTGTDTPAHPGPTPDLPGTFAQVRHLIGLRRSMLGPRARVLATVAVTLGVAALPVALTLGAGARTWLPRLVVVDAVELTAGLLLVLAVGLVVSAVASPTGRELLPRRHLVSYPVSASTEHLAALVLAPVNLAWSAQVVGAAAVIGLHAADTAHTGTVPGWLVLTVAGLLFTGLVAALTALGQVLAWVVELVRTLPGGVWAVRFSFLGAGLGAVHLVRGEVLVGLLARAPTRFLTDQVAAAALGRWVGPVVTLLALAAVTSALTWAGARLHRWLLARPTRAQTRSETAAHRLRRLPGPQAWAADLRLWRRQDWATVLRSLPLRRGLLVLLLTPAAGAFLARLAWSDLVILSAVVATGAGLLFGVNMFALDGEGAVWRESLPTGPRVWAGARLLVLTETVVLVTALTTAAAAVSARGQATPAAVTVLLVAVPTFAGQIVSRCLCWSIDHPERAELRTSRDSPVSPGRLLSTSARLMGATLTMAILLAVVVRIGWPPLALLVVLPSWTMSLLRLRTGLRRWQDHQTRARVVQVVARG